MSRAARAALGLAVLLAGAGAAVSAAQEVEAKPFPLPFFGEEARKRGVELPLPFGVGPVYYHLERAIEISDVRVGRNGAPPVSVSHFAQLASSSNVENVNLKLDVWLLPFLNVYAIVGGVWNQSSTDIEVTLPPILPGGVDRTRRMSVPTELSGSVGGVGATLVWGKDWFFVAADFNAARADLGFDDKFKAVITSLRAGWNGKVGGHPLRVWLNGTYWDTFTTAKGTVADPDGGTLAFEVDEGPLHPYTYGAGLSYGLSKRVEIATDFGTDFHGGWYVALAPVYRF